MKARSDGLFGTSEYLASVSGNPRKTSSGRIASLPASTPESSEDDAGTSK